MKKNKMKLTSSSSSKSSSMSLLSPPIIYNNRVEKITMATSLVRLYVFVMVQILLHSANAQCLSRFQSRAAAAAAQQPSTAVTESTASRRRILYSAIPPSLSSLLPSSPSQTNSRTIICTTRTCTRLYTPLSTSSTNQQTSSTDSSLIEQQQQQQQQPDAVDMIAYCNGFKTVFNETPCIALVSTELPDDLERGTYYRNGPAMFSAGSIVPPKKFIVQPEQQPVKDGSNKNVRMVKHYMEGDGAVLAITFAMSMLLTVLTAVRAMSRMTSVAIIVAAKPMIVNKNNNNNNNNNQLDL